MIVSFDEPSRRLSDKVDDIEKTIFLKGNSKISLEDLYFHKSQTRITKKLLQIMQNVINQVEVSDKSKSALQDIKDKILSLILSYDEVSEDSNNLLNTYLSVNAQKNNDVMKLLTIFSAFFLPLTFIAGIYGMNFENMPELTWQAGYFLTLGVMAVVAIVIYVWFKRKRII
jgi:magnesium transporter